jgi:multiple sugar transport system permease protein
MAEKAIEVPGVERWPRTKPLTARRSRAGLKQVALHFLLLVVALFFAFPFIWLVTSSLKDSTQIFVFPPVLWPNPIRWVNYPLAFDEMHFAHYLVNTLTVTVPSVVGTLISSAMPAYAFSRLNWPGRDLVFVLVLGTMMLPFAVTMIPVYLLFHALGWIGTYLPLIVPHFFGGAFFIFLLRQFFLSIPVDISEAAEIDGANELRIFLQMIIPLSGPVVATTVLLSFIWTYNEFLQPLIYLTNDSMYTLALGIVTFVGSNIQKWELLMAAAVMYCIPNIVLYFFAQKHFIRGIATTGMKS